MIEEIRKCGARILLIQDGDILLAAATNQGVLWRHSSCYEVCRRECKIFYKNDADKKKAAEYKIKNFDKIYEIDDLVSSNLFLPPLELQTV